MAEAPTPKYMVDQENGEVYAYNRQLFAQNRFGPLYGDPPPIGPDGKCRVPNKDEPKFMPAEEGSVFAGPDEVVVAKKLEEEESKEEFGAVEDVIDKIVLAIPNLMSTDFTAQGLPKIESLERNLGFSVSGKERNEAYEKYEKMKIED